RAPRPPRRRASACSRPAGSRTLLHVNPLHWTEERPGLVRQLARVLPQPGFHRQRGPERAAVGRAREPRVAHHQHSPVGRAPNEPAHALPEPHHRLRHGVVPERLEAAPPEPPPPPPRPAGLRPGERPPPPPP